MKKILAIVALVLSGGAVQAASVGLSGEHFQVNASIANIAAAEAVIAGAAGPTATFDATALDYADGSSGRSLSTWLGTNGSISSGVDSSDVASSVFRFTGSILLGAGVQTFATSSDDGFSLRLNGAVASEFPGNRGFGTTTSMFDAGLGGVFAFELIFWDGINQIANNDTGLTVRLNGQVIDDTITTNMAPVPLPAAMPLMLVGLGLGAVYGRRRKRA